MPQCSGNDLTMPRHYIGWLATALFLAGCAANGSSVAIPPVTVEGARAAPAPLAATLQLPTGAGPHSVVIVLHGCGGLGANQRAWAERLQEWGYGSLVLNSFSARGVMTVCSPANQPLVTRFDRSADVIAAARWLQTVPGVDGSRIAVLGESHGGGTAIEVASRQMEASEDGLIKGVVDYYGPCRAPAMHGTTPILALAGMDDTWGDPARTCTNYAEAVAGQQPVTVQTYPGVVHAFDNSRLPLRRYNEGHPMQYDQSAAEDSFRRVRAFLGTIIGPGTR